MREFTLETPDGRLLACAETGDPAAPPIVFHHGTPGRKSSHNLSGPAVAGARVIVYDRPGYGGSQPHPGRTVGSCASDVAAIADHLGLAQFAVLGSSGGGPHALACAALLPERTRAVAVVAGFAPADSDSFDFFAGMSDLNIGEMQAAAAGPSQLERLLAAFVEEVGTEPDAMLDAIVAELSEPDQQALARPEVRAIYRDAIGAAVSGGLAGWIDDDLAFMRAWGFELAAVEPPLFLLQGELDVIVPSGHMRHLAESVEGSTLQILPGAGHILHDEGRLAVDWLLARS